jgi:putative DNA methylase
MLWDFAEVNHFSSSTRNFLDAVTWVVEALETLPTAPLKGTGTLQDAARNVRDISRPIISTDPPYYDNIGYADLSDFFYIWLRRSLLSVYPSLFSTMLVPKSQELVATPYRFGGSKAKAQQFFEQGLEQAFQRMRQAAHGDFPLTVYYAFKQSEADSGEQELGNRKQELGNRKREIENREQEIENSKEGANDDTLSYSLSSISYSLSSISYTLSSKSYTSTGWETMLNGLIRSGFQITGTWPMRSERGARSNAIGTNVLASSIVLVCRPRPEGAPTASRREFLTVLRRELPQALRELQQGNIAPVDLAQAAIGPGMAVYSRYTRVLDSDGTPMSVRTALTIINQLLDEVLAEQEGEFDSDTRWALAWFEQFGLNAGPYGDAETLSKAKNTSVAGMVRAGMVQARGGRVQLLDRDELPAGWEPAQDADVPVWEATQQLVKALYEGGEERAAALLSKLGGRAEVARDLAYRLYSLCERKKWTQEARGYNALVLAWPELSRLAARSGVRQEGMFS